MAKKFSLKRYLIRLVAGLALAIFATIAVFQMIQSGMVSLSASSKQLSDVTLECGKWATSKTNDIPARNQLNAQCVNERLAAIKNTKNP
jgi:hypothetical protein